MYGIFRFAFIVPVGLVLGRLSSPSLRGLLLLLCERRGRLVRDDLCRGPRAADHRHFAASRRSGGGRRDGRSGQGTAERKCFLIF